MNSEQGEPVIQYCIVDALYEKKRQPIKLYGCITKTTVAKFYGTYKIFDKEDRLLGTSKQGTISWKRDDLQTEEAKVWYDSIAGFSDQYKELANVVKDPGLCFSHIPQIFIEFEDAPDAEENNNRRFDHVHIIYSVSNFWNNDEKLLIYNQ